MADVAQLGSQRFKVGQINPDDYIQNICNSTGYEKAIVIYHLKPTVPSVRG